MESMNLAALTKKIYDSDLIYLSMKTLNDVLGLSLESAKYGIIRRLVKHKVIKKIERDKYVLANHEPDTFALAHFLYTPSYISCETALNAYGILSQFPYEVISCSTRKTKQKQIDDRIFNYLHIKKELFWGYEKKSNYLIARPEKALLDQIYFSIKRLKTLNLEEYDFNHINTTTLKQFLRLFETNTYYDRILLLLKEYVKI